MFLASTSSALMAPHALLAEIARHARSPPPPPPPPADLAAAGGALTVRLAALSRLLEEVAATSDEEAARGAASRGALYDRAFSYAAKKERLRVERSESAMEECTFTPHINRGAPTRWEKLENLRTAEPPVEAAE